MAVADDPSIPDDLKLYRRINPTVHMVRDHNLECERISSGAFKPEEMSVILDDTLRDSGREPKDVITPAEPHLVTFTAGQVRGVSETLGAVRTPRPEECAHADIVGKKTKPIKRELVRLAKWESPPETPEGCCDPPSGSA
jgi:hypothetical protein